MDKTDLVGSLHDFSEALDALKAGMEVARAKWPEGTVVSLQKPDAHSKMTQPYIFIEHPIEIGSKRLYSRVPWVPTFEDLITEDWRIVE